MSDEYVMYLVVRTDLGMSPGKVAAQVGHGVQLAMRWAELDEGRSIALENWEGADYPKVVLAADSKQFADLLKTDQPSVAVEDTGRTELVGNNLTVLAFCPATRTEMRPIVGHLKLYK